MSMDAAAVAALGLDRLARRLDDAAKPGEDVFLALGKRLEQAVGVIHHLTAGLGDLSDTIDGAKVQDAAAGLGGAAQRVGEIVDSLSGEGEALGRLTETLQAGSRSLGLLRRTIGEVAILGINAKIQAAQMAGVSGDFAVFTNEIARLAVLAGEDLDGLEKGHLAVSKLIGEADSRQESFVQTHGQALREVGRRLQHSLDLLRGHHERSHGLVAAIRRKSDEIARRVGDAVMALQVNDMTRQRIEHSAQGLRTGQDLLGAPGVAMAGDLDDDRRRQVTAVILRLQSRQLVETAEHFEGEVNRLLDHLKTLAADTDSVLRQEISLGQGSDDGSIFATLRGEIAAATKLCQDFTEARGSIRGLIGSLTEAVAKMTSHIEAVHEIEADIRVMGLNATLRCARLGSQGKALVVIAQELRQSANRTEEHARVVEASLRSLMTEAETLSRLGSSQEEQAGETLITVMGNSLDILTETQADFESRLAPMVHEAGQAKTLLDQAATGTDVHQRVGAELRAVAAELERQAVGLTRSSDDLTAVTPRALQLLGDNYTMASERDVHTSFLDGGGSVKAGAGNVAAAADVDDFLF